MVSFYILDDLFVLYEHCRTILAYSDNKKELENYRVALKLTNSKKIYISTIDDYYQDAYEDGRESRYDY